VIFGWKRNFCGALFGTHRHQFSDADSFFNNLATAANHPLIRRYLAIHYCFAQAQEALSNI